MFFIEEKIISRYPQVGGFWWHAINRRLVEVPGSQLAELSIFHEGEIEEQKTYA